MNPMIALVPASKDCYGDHGYKLLGLVAQPETYPSIFYFVMPRQGSHRPHFLSSNWLPVKLCQWRH